MVSEEKDFKNQPIRNKSRLWQPCLLTNRDEMSNLYRGPSIDASYQVSFQKHKLFENWNLSWGKTTFTVLGINFDVDISKITKINYEKYLIKMKGLFKQWNKRNLTPIGKITVVKSLILPVLNHLFIALPNPSIEIIKDIEDMLYTFIWKSSVNRVKKDIMQKEYQEGR